MIFRTRRISLLSAVAALVVLLGACEDLPTRPEIVRQRAGELGWLAIPAPAELPDLDGMLDDAGPDPLALETREMLADVRAARRAGDWVTARRLHDRAVVHATPLLAEETNLRVLLSGMGALDRWVERVETEVGLVPQGRLGADLDDVRRRRAAAARSLEAGDTAAALVEMHVAAGRVREHVPEAVALRALQTVDAELAGVEEIDRVRAKRIRRLLWAAEDDLAAGDGRRGLLRALYALQLLSGHQVLEPSADPEARR